MGMHTNAGRIKQTCFKLVQTWHRISAFVPWSDGQLYGLKTNWGSKQYGEDGAVS